MHRHMSMHYVHTWTRTCFRASIEKNLNSPNSFSYRGSNGVGITGLGATVDPSAKTADNFCAQARYFVHVAFATLRRFRSVAPLLQKNIMVSAHFSFQTEFQGLGDTDGLRESPESPLRPSRELPGSVFEYLGGFFNQI